MPDGKTSSEVQRRAFTRLTFTAEVRDAQTQYGAREAMQRLEAMPEHDSLTPDLIESISRCDSFFIGTANAEGWPHIQHRGGPPGFLKALDEKTLAFADFEGNRQYITVGNLAGNARVFLFLIDYEKQTRLKLWGRAEVVENDAALLEWVAASCCETPASRVIRVRLEAWDRNCRRFIPSLVPKAQADALTADYERRLAAAEARPTALLRAMLGPDPG